MVSDKRASTEDQSILEEAYKRDPKPDKAARQELVKQVALGEKEVQVGNCVQYQQVDRMVVTNAHPPKIWFQNRRQSSRRKARPLLPHEVAQYQASRAGAAPSYSAPFNPPNFGSDDSNATIPDETLSENQHHSTPPPPSSLPRAPPGADFHDGYDAQRAPEAETPTAGYSALAAYQALQSGTSGRHSLPATANYGYLANKRRASSFRDDPEPNEYLPGSERVAGADSDRPLKKSSSFVRLSMTSEGAAKIITKDSPSPSPPRPSQQLRQSFNSSHGPGVPSLDLARVSRDIGNPLRRSASGRSHDSRAWEFWCDKDARNDQEEQAEKDASGSAADAIGLMRANSGRRVLGSLPAKRNATVMRQSSAKRTKLDHPRPSLHRSNTSAGRLQHGVETVPKSALKLKYSESGASIYIPGNESDKENWSPERNVLPSSQPVMGSSSGKLRRTALGESRANPGKVPRTGKRPPQTPRPRAAAEKVTDPDQDPELAAFMRDRKSSSISGEEELDCVQGLLSLSQGRWP
jgi:hypothetical protein